MVVSTSAVVSASVVVVAAAVVVVAAAVVVVAAAVVVVVAAAAVVEAAKVLADKRRKHPVELMSEQAFRDSIYRQMASTAGQLDEEMGKLSEGELICMRLGFVLEQVTVTNLWLLVNDNRLPKENDYLLFRKKRSEYFQKKLKRIYGNQGNQGNQNNQKVNQERKNNR